MKHILTFTLLSIASLCAAQRAEVDIDTPKIVQVEKQQPAPDTISLTIEDIQDVVCKDNEPLRALVRVWYMQALHTGRNDAQAVEIALDKLGKFLIEKIENK